MAKTRYGQLGLKERIEIYRLHADGKSRRMIARILGRNASTVSRELRRNSKPSHQWAGGYDPQRAQQLMQRRHARGRAHKLERNLRLRQQVLDRLAMGWSPEQIAGRLAKGQPRPPVSYESIYRYIYWRSWSFNETLHRLLPRQKYRRGKRRSHRRWSKRAILQRVSIHDRPSLVDRRTHSGHWEADLMSFSKQGQFLLVAHERKSRWTLLVRQNFKSAQSVADNLSRVCGGCRCELAGPSPSITASSSANIICCIENTASKPGSAIPILRGKRAASKTPSDDSAAVYREKLTSTRLQKHSLAGSSDRYNNTPRKCLGFKTPNEVFFERLLHFKREFTPSLRSG